MNHNHYHGESSYEPIWVILFLLLILFYSLAALRHNKWPLSRYVFWGLGLFCIMITLTGPISNLAHEDFTFHMLGHLLLGMLAPLLLALAAPMTLIFRTLSLKKARSLSRFLKSRPVSMYRHPVLASFLNIGGLWLLYTTGMYASMKENIFLHVLVHIHVFVAGYLYTISIVYIDPAPHRYSYTFRSIVLILSLAGHSILSKYLYTHPPAGVPLEQAEQGAMMMYYGGDVIDMILIWLLCYQWYKATSPRITQHKGDLESM
nr:cytochrome c oxidase assembly protein [Neobacillus sp. Marseille-Q6967]